MIGCLIEIGVLVASAIAALFAGKHGRAPTVISAVGVVVAAACALPWAIASLAGADPEEVAVTWAPPIEQLRLGIDPMSAFFIVPLMVIGATCGIYGAA